MPASPIVQSHIDNGGKITRVRDEDDRGRPRTITFAYQLGDTSLDYACAVYHETPDSPGFRKEAHNETAILRLGVRPIRVVCEDGLPAPKERQDFLHACFLKYGARGPRN